MRPANVDIDIHYTGSVVLAVAVLATIAVIAAITVRQGRRSGNKWHAITRNRIRNRIRGKGNNVLAFYKSGMAPKRDSV